MFLFTPSDHLTFMALVAGALLIGISKAGFGGGPGMLVPPLLALFLPPRVAIGVMLPLQLATDIVAMRFYWGRWDRRNVLPILAGASFGIVAGTGILGRLEPDHLKKAIGLRAVLLGGAEMVRGRLMRAERVMPPIPWLGVTTGVVSGIGSTVAHQGGLPVILYLVPQRLDSGVFVGTTTAIFFFVNAAKMLPYAWLGMLPPETLRTDLLLLPAVILGTVLGVRLNERVPREWFLRIVMWFVLAAGIKLLLG